VEAQRGVVRLHARLEAVPFLLVRVLCFFLHLLLIVYNTRDIRKEENKFQNTDIKDNASKRGWKERLGQIILKNASLTR